MNNYSKPTYERITRKAWNNSGIWTWKCSGCNETIVVAVRDNYVVEEFCSCGKKYNIYGEEDFLQEYNMRYNPNLNPHDIRYASGKHGYFMWNCKECGEINKAYSNEDSGECNCGEPWIVDEDGLKISRKVIDEGE